MTIYRVVKYNRETREQQATNIESTFIQSLWRLASTWNREQNVVAFTIEPRG